jgi:dolichyl-diphosphooligosaccharide--protein glycosyltransferase
MVNLIDVCIYSGPVWSVVAVLLAYLYGVLIGGSTLGVLVAAITSFIPGLISRSVAGGYDYECMAITVLVGCLYTFSLTLKTGSILGAVLSGLCYGYMALTWGGYVFIANCIPLFVAALIVFGRFSYRLYITYSVWFVVSTVLSASIPFIGPKIAQKPEHFAMIGVFVVVQVWGLFAFLRWFFELPSFATLVVSSIQVFPLGLFAIITIGVSTGLLGGFSGRLLQMVDPSHAVKGLPIIASVAEHRPSSWAMYFLDCGFFLVVFPLGCFLILRDGLSQKTEVRFLVLIYGLSTLYFASVMVRLVLVFTPALALVAGFGLHRMLKAALRHRDTLSVVCLITLFVMSLFTCLHSVWFSCYSYSSDQLNFPVRTGHGDVMSDDYREGYRWLWTNTDRNARVMSWWDYGYQIASLGGRACHADGNTNNFTHIGIVGMTMASQEEVSWRLARMLEADYMLVIFGGASGYSSDDVNKFLWMPRIANQTFRNISDELYIPTGDGPMFGPGMTHNMRTAALFKFCYHRFAKFEFGRGMPAGDDVARRNNMAEIPARLSRFQEAFTTRNWIVRIYRVLPDPIWERVY